jgi:hypothetical protein
MPGLDPGIHVFGGKKDVDGRVKPGHDDDFFGLNSFWPVVLVKA